MIEVLAGDLKTRIVTLIGGKIHASEAPGGFFSIPKSNSYAIESVEIITEDNKKKYAAAAGWATIGTIAFGPLGGLAGVVFGGNKKEVCFACELAGGKRFMGKCSPAEYKKLYAASFNEIAPQVTETIPSDEHQSTGPIYGFCPECAAKNQRSFLFCQGCGKSLPWAAKK